MIYAVPFGIALLVSGLASYQWGGKTERHTTILLSIVWVGTVCANLSLGVPSVYTPLLYAIMDLLALRWLVRHQTLNWQWIIAGLFTVMLLNHAIYVVGVSLGLFSYQGSFYQHILAISGYLQIVSIWFAIWKGRSSADTIFARWYSGADWVSSWSLVCGAENEGPERDFR